MRKFLLSLFVILLFTSLPQAQVIKINVEKGQKYLLENSYNTSDSSEIGGHSFQTNVESKTFYVYEVISTGEKETIFKVTTTRIISNIAVSGILITKQKNDSNEDSIAGKKSKVIGKPKKIVVDNNGYIMKQDDEEKLYIDNDSIFTDKQYIKGKYEDPMKDWDFSRSRAPVDFFIPLFIGKELKVGDSFPYIDSSTVEKRTTSFSINVGKMNTRNSGTYTIKDIENGIAIISYIGTHLFSIQDNIMGEFTNSISKGTVKTQLQVDINTGMLMSKITEEDAIRYAGDTDKSSESTSKSISIIKVTLIQ